MSDSIGKTEYISISEKIPEDDKDFGDIWDIISANNKKYYIGKRHVVVENKDSLEILSFDFDILASFALDGELIIVNDEAIFFVNNNNLQIICELDINPKDRNYILKTHDSEFIIINDKPTRYNLNKLLGNKEGFVTPVTIDSISLLTNMKIFSHNKDEYGNIVFGGLGGLLIYDKNFKFLYKISKDEGFPTNGVFNTFFDSYGNIWVAHSKGLSIIEFNSPFTIFNQHQNVSDGNILVAEYKNNVYLSSISEIRKLKKGDPKFTIIDESDYNNFSTTIVKVPNDSVLLLTSNGQILYTNGDGMKVLYASNSIIMSVFWTPKHKDIIFFGTLNGLSYFRIKYKNNELIADTAIATDIKGMITNLASDNDGNIWASSYSEGVCKLTINSSNNEFTSNLYNDNNGLLRTKNRVYFINSLNKLVVLNKKIYSTAKDYNPNIDNYTFVEDTSFFKELANTKILNVLTYKNNRIILIGKSSVYSYTKQKNNTWTIDSTNYKRLLPLVSTEPEILISSNGIEWIPFGNELVRIDPSKFKNTVKESLLPIINRIALTNDSTIYYGHNANLLKNISEFEFKNNSLSFEYSLPFFIEENTFSYFLEGFSKNWSNYSPETKAVFTNLNEGTYTFKIKAKNIYAIESNIVSYTFTINPPWYRTIWMYFIYFIILGLVIALSIYLFTRNLKASNKRLEITVSERTKEIQHKNILITDSINYARHIQKAVLPSIKTINNSFNNSFVYFKPRDIVSGDFYWYKQRNKSHFIAISDCTGHGVPGAFMSMIGNTLLNQIITEPEIKTPADVLNRLNTEIRIAFADSDSQDDGMDITVCKINYDNNVFELSLANHIAIIVKNGRFEEVVGDIYSIGGPFAKPEGKSFTNIVKTIEKGTNLYMFSDGYADQFGGDNNKKFNLTKFKELLIEISEQEMNEQLTIINKYFKDWKGEFKQIDDVLVMGIKF